MGIRQFDYEQSQSGVCFTLNLSTLVMHFMLRLVNPQFDVIVYFNKLCILL